MKKIFCIYFFLVGGFYSLAQTGAFKKILSDRATVDREVFFDQLAQFQKENVEFSNVYYQLGKVELEIFSSLDPIVDRVASRQRIYNSKTNFGLAKNYLDPKEVSRFPDWYDVSDTTSKDSVSSVGVGNVERSYSNTEDYAVLYEELVANYDKAVFHYLKAREKFIEINTSADNLRQLFLKADDSLKIAVRSVGVSFDSSMFYVDKYRGIYQKLPYKKKRKVDINRREIDHFRMNGITPANFLADEIDVWDYRRWSDGFLNLLKVEVDGLQDEIKTAFTFFVETNERMMNGDECIQAQLDDLKFQRIINLITKYDQESVLIDIFKYLVSKLGYGNKYVYERVCNDLNAPPTDDFLSRKVRIYQNMFASLKETDSLNSVITSSGHGQSSFQWFFDDQMPGENGSTTFAQEQKDENQSSFKGELVNLINKIKEQNFETDSLFECYEVDGDLLVMNESAENKLCIEKKLWLNDTLQLLMAKLESQNLLIGAKPIEEDYQKVWEIKPLKNSAISYFKIVGDSSCLIGGLSGKAWLSQVSSSGQENFKTLLKSADPIENVVVNQLQGVATVLQGSNTSHTITKVNFNGKIVSSNSLELPGEYVGMFRQEQDLWFFSHESSSEGSKIIASVYNQNDKTISRQVAYSFNSSLKKPSIIKNDDEYFSLLSSSDYSDDEIVYALLNYEGEIEHEIFF